MSISGIRYAALFDDDANSPTAGTVVQLNNLEAEGEFYVNGQGSETIAGIDLHAGDESHAEMGFADKDGYEQLEEWQRKETPLKLAVAGIQDNGLWYQAAPIRVQDQSQFSPGNRSFAQFFIDSDTPYPEIHNGINLLELVSGNEVLFPIEGAELTLSADGGTGNLELEALDYAGTQLAIQSTAAASRASVSLDLPADVYTVVATLPSGAVDAALRTDGMDEYTEA